MIGCSNDIATSSKQHWHVNRSDCVACFGMHTDECATAAASIDSVSFLGSLLRRAALDSFRLTSLGLCYNGIFREREAMVFVGFSGFIVFQGNVPTSKQDVVLFVGMEC